MGRRLITLGAERTGGGSGGTSDRKIESLVVPAQLVKIENFKPKVEAGSLTGIPAERSPSKRGIFARGLVGSESATGLTIFAICAKSWAATRYPPLTKPRVDSGENYAYTRLNALVGSHIVAWH